MTGLLSLMDTMMNFAGNGRRGHFRRGFTLIELAIVLTILGLLLGGGSMLLQPLLDSNKRNETKARLKVIEDALVLYAATNFDLPCPSNPTLGPSDSANGDEDACSSAMTSGGVPWRALGLSEADVLDGWGRRISYAVTTTLTVPRTTPPVGDPPLDCPAQGFSVILQGKLENRGANNAAIPPTPAGVTAAPAKAAYILVSHGENGYGGYLPSGAQTPATLASTSELSNIKAVGAGASATVIFYYEKRATGDTIVGFDDIVRSQTSGQIAIAYGCERP